MRVNKLITGKQILKVKYKIDQVLHVYLVICTGRICRERVLYLVSFGESPLHGRILLLRYIYLVQVMLNIELSLDTRTVQLEASNFSQDVDDVDGDH